MPGAQMGMVNLSDLFQKTFRTKKKTIKTTIADAKKLLLQDQMDELLDMDAVHKNAIDLVQNHGIVFIDEIDKICTRQQHKGGDISREGVQRDLLPLIEGTSVQTKYGFVKTDHILFIASGAFHVSKPSDLLPELQGRLPIRVELQPLSQSDFVKILMEPEHNLLTQAIALLKTEGITLSFDIKAINDIARLATVANTTIENIGARRLHTIIEKLLEDISFDAPDLTDKVITITKEMVIDIIEPIVKKQDLSQFIL
jgi:ATP-dependent HslUV protease ATP-binding subunit HslU